MRGPDLKGRYPTSRDVPEGASSISRGGVLAHRGGFGTFGWTGTGRWTDSEAGKTYDSAAATPHPEYPHGPGSAAVGRAEGTARSPGDGPESTPPGIAASSPPSGRIGKSNRASNLKSQPVAFGTSRPTRTPTEESNPPTLKWRGRRPRAGLHAVARERPPAANYPGPHVRPPPLLRARSPPLGGFGRGS